MAHPKRRDDPPAALSSPFGVRRTALLFCGTALFALLGCGNTPTPPLVHANETRLFEEAYGDITRYYIEPIGAEAVAMAALGNLRTVEARFSVERRDRDVVVHFPEGEAEHFAAPAAADAPGWAALTNAVITKARARSAAIGEMSADALDQVLLEGGMRTLDRFSHYSPPAIARERRAARDGFGGIGVTLDRSGDPTRIVDVLPDTPAAVAGLRVDDHIVAIDGVEVAALPQHELSRRLRGPDDSFVTLSITRAGVADVLRFSLQRAHIVPETASLSLENGVAHLRLTSFNQHTAQEAARLLQQAHREAGTNLHGVILDLRGNPGGLLDQSIEVASLFLDGVPVTSTVGRVPESVQYFTAPHREVETLPLVVLVNGGSASAAEIVASALQDTGRAVVAGTASYGKGTVQNVQRLSNDAEMTITWARLITPGGYILHEHGVVPTVCTANLGDDTASVAEALGHRRGHSSELAAELHEPRAALDDEGWKKLRNLCPPERDDRGIDMRVAMRLLDDPVAYAHALGAPGLPSRKVAAARLTR